MQLHIYFLQILFSYCKASLPDLNQNQLFQRDSEITHLMTIVELQSFDSTHIKVV